MKPNRSINRNRFVIGIMLALAIVACAAAAFAISGAMAFMSLGEGQTAALEKLEDALQRIGTVQSNDLTETSGIDFSKRFPGMIWCHNDSGNSPTAFLVHTSGRVAAKCSIKKAKNFDWEDNCCFEYKGHSYVLIGDVGDNAEARKSCELLLFKEPDFALDSNKVVTHPIKNAISIVFTYEDGPRNCEAIAFDSKTNSVLLIQKIFGRTRMKRPPGIYQIDITPWLDHSTSSAPKQGSAARIAEFPTHSVTGMDISDDNNSMVIRNYFSAHLFQKTDEQSWTERLNSGPPKNLIMPIERQGEAICLSNDGKSIIVTSEYMRQPIWEVQVDKAIQD